MHPTVITLVCYLRSHVSPSSLVFLSMCWFSVQFKSRPNEMAYRWRNLCQAKKNQTTGGIVTEGVLAWSLPSLCCWIQPRGTWECAECGESVLEQCWQGRGNPELSGCLHYKHLDLEAISVCLFIIWIREPQSLGLWVKLKHRWQLRLTEG